MTRPSFTPALTTNFPSTNQALFAIASWPGLYAAACWQTPEIADYLVSIGLSFSMWQIFTLASPRTYFFLRGTACSIAVFPAVMRSRLPDIIDWVRWYET